MHRKAPVFNNSRPLTSVKFRQIPISFVFFVLVVFNSKVNGHRRLGVLLARDIFVEKALENVERAYAKLDVRL